MSKSLLASQLVRRLANEVAVNHRNLTLLYQEAAEFHGKDSRAVEFMQRRLLESEELKKLASDAMIESENLEDAVLFACSAGNTVFLEHDPTLFIDTGDNDHSEGQDNLLGNTGEILE